MTSRYPSRFARSRFAEARSERDEKFAIRDWNEATARLASAAASSAATCAATTAASAATVTAAARPIPLPAARPAARRPSRLH